jgi:hypothetical protein
VEVFSSEPLYTQTAEVASAVIFQDTRFRFIIDARLVDPMVNARLFNSLHQAPHVFIPDSDGGSLQYAFRLCSWTSQNTILWPVYANLFVINVKNVSRAIVILCSLVLR